MNALDNFIQSAHTAGMPRDQLEGFIRGQYIPLPWQLRFHALSREADKSNGPVKIGVGGSRGPGKALSLDTPIFTKKGWSLMQDLGVGDIVFSPDGKQTRITGVSEVQEDRRCFDVLFSDGSLITADAEHLWWTFNKEERVALVRRDDEFRKKRRGKRNNVHKSYLVGKNVKAKPIGGYRTTQDICNTLMSGKEVNHSVLLSKPVKIRKKKFIINPYLLGVWLGDGDKARGYITSVDKQILDETGENIIYIDKNRYRVDGLTTKLRKVGVLYNKHIPNEYFISSIQQRIDLLQGLNDTDGYVDSDGGIEFTNTNKRLANQYYELVCSLGVRATIKKGKATLDGRIISDKWRIRYRATFPAFRLKRKLENQKMDSSSYLRYRYIIDVKERDSVPVKCITVDSPSHLYLAGKSFIPTHNSHAVFAQVGIDDCQRVDHLKGLFLRQTGKAAQESFEDLISKVLYKKVSYEYNRSRNTLNFPNKSKILLGGFENERDVDKYIGIEYDFIAVEELNQLTKDKIDKLLGSMRTSKLNWRPRMYASFNPGGLGHSFVKNLFVIPFRNGVEDKTRFIPSGYKDNPYLNEEYIDYLKGLEGSLGKMWREGDWDVFAGQYFSEFNRDVHVVLPFTIPEGWRKFRAYDHGRTNPACCLWFALDYDGNVWIYREFYQTGLDIDDIASDIKELSKGEKYLYSVADPSIFSKTGMIDRLGGQTIAESFSKRDVFFQAGSNRRVDGWQIFHQYLAHSKDKKPKLRVFNTCKNFIKEVAEAICDDRRPEDLDTDSSDHSLDACRYSLMRLKERKVGRPKSEAEKMLGSYIEEKQIDTRFPNESLKKGYEAFKKRYAK